MSADFYEMSHFQVDLTPEVRSIMEHMVKAKTDQRIGVLCVLFEHCVQLEALAGQRRAYPFALSYLASWIDRQVTEFGVHPDLLHSMFHEAFEAHLVARAKPQGGVQ